MHRTIFDTPGINSVLRALSIGFLKLTGWKIEGSLPPNGAKSVLIAAPHTSNWDLPYTLMVAFALRLNIYWMGKHQIFRPPFRSLMMWLGGIPVHRESANNLVAASAAAIKAANGPLQLVVPPEVRAARCATGRAAFITLRWQPRYLSCSLTWTLSARSAAWGRCFNPPATWRPTCRPSRLFTNPTKAKTQISPATIKLPGREFPSAPRQSS